MTTPSVPQPTHQTRNQNPEPRNQNPENSDIRASHFQPRVWSAVWKLPALFWSVLAVAIMSDKSETPSPSLSRVFPFSTVVIVAILVMFKYERVEEMVQVIANYFDIPRDATVVLIVAFVIVLVFLAYGVWSGAYYVINLRKSRDAAGLIYIRERNALIALFNSLDGKQWKDKTRWCSNEPIERWKGVKIDHNTGRVNKLLLADNQLGGTCNSSLISLLKFVVFFFNVCTLHSVFLSRFYFFRLVLQYFTKLPSYFLCQVASQRKLENWRV